MHKIAEKLTWIDIPYINNKIPCAGNSSRITLPGENVPAFFGGIRGVILIALLACWVKLKIPMETSNGH